MSGPPQNQIRNRLLTSLSAESFERLRPNLEPVDLPMRMLVVVADETTEHVYFVESGLGSIVAASPNEERIEVGHVGRDGVTGTHVFHDVASTPNYTLMQVAGTGLRMPVRALTQAMEEDGALRRLLLRYVHTCEIQLAHSALANGRYNMNERLARWLLMCHDRMDGNELPLTHEFLSLMLGVRRSGVTNELHVIEGMGVIKATRGNIRVLDRTRLEEVAGGCYGLPEREYERVIGVPLRAA